MKMRRPSALSSVYPAYFASKKEAPALPRLARRRSYTNKHRETVEIHIQASPRLPTPVDQIKWVGLLVTKYSGIASRGTPAS